MPIKLPQGFNIQSREPIDKRMVLSKSEMLSINDNLMPNQYFAICKDDNQFYVYKKSAVPNEVTGKFSLITNYIEPASASSAGLVKSSSNVDYISVNEDGTMEVNQITVDKLVNSESTTLVIDGGSAPTTTES